MKTTLTLMLALLSVGCGGNPQADSNDVRKDVRQFNFTVDAGLSHRCRRMFSASSSFYNRVRLEPVLLHLCP